MSSQKTIDEDALERAALIGAATEVVQRYGSAAKEYIVAQLLCCVEV